MLKYIKQYIKRLQNIQGMTLMEILLVASLISIISVAIYNALSNGLRVWERSRQVVVEEDIAIFIDKLTTDLHNTFFYSKIKIEGNDYRFTFPTMVSVMADKRGPGPYGEYQDQLGRVEYYFDYATHAIYRRQANYSQAIMGDYFSQPQLLVSLVDRLKIEYYYLTDEGEVFSQDIFDVLPSGLEITVEFSDSQKTKKFFKVVNVPLNM